MNPIRATISWLKENPKKVTLAKKSLPEFCDVGHRDGCGD